MTTTKNRTPPTGSLETRKATFTGSSVNLERRTAELVFATETPVLRSTWSDGKFYEVLSLDKKSVRMDRINSGRANLLIDHGGSSVDSIVGVIESARIANGQGIATVRFARDAASDVVFQKVADGIIRNVSVGYRTHKLEKVVSGDGATPTFRATDWEPAEISLVAMPADPNSFVRSQQSNPSNRSSKMSTPNEEQGSGDVAQRERVRVDGIRQSVRTARLETSIAEDLVRSGVSLDAARSQVIEILAQRSDASQESAQYEGDFKAGSRISGGETADEKFVRGASAWLFEKSSNGVVQRAVAAKAKGFEKVDLDGGEFRGMSLLDLARESLERRGQRTRGMSKMQMIGLALTHRSSAYAPASDFAILFENVMHKTLLGAYATAPDSWKKFCKIETVPDFRDSNRFRVGSFGPLDTVAPGTEYKNKAIPDGQKTAISTETKGNIIALSREAIVNDDMSAMADLASRFGRAAALGIEIEVYALLAENSGLGPTQSDSQPFFHSNRANVNGTGSALSVAGLDADRVILATQRDISSNEYLDLRPSCVLVPISLGSAARRLNTADFDNDGTQLMMPNVCKGLFRDVVDSPRIAGTRRYLFADPAVAPAMVVAFLEGSGEAPYLEQQLGWRVDGTEWKARIDFKAQMFDPKGAVTNAGQ